MGTKRYSAIHASFSLGPAQFTSLLAALRDTIASVFNFSAEIVVDDQMIDYFGQDMRDVGIASKLPGKGHDYGLFSVGAAIKLSLWVACAGRL